MEGGGLYLVEHAVSKFKILLAQMKELLLMEQEGNLHMCTQFVYKNRGLRNLVHTSLFNEIDLIVQEVETHVNPMYWCAESIKPPKFWESITSLFVCKHKTMLNTLQP